MFPTELMIARKTRDGFVRPVFLTDENSDYAVKVLNTFNSSVGKKKDEIEDNIKNLEIKAQNHKIIRALALIMFRKSEFIPPSNLNSEAVREALFKKARIPAYFEYTKTKILEETAKEFNVSVAEIMNAMYSDRESELILKTPYFVVPNTLAKMFNLEQIETLLLRSGEMSVSKIQNWYLLIKKIKSLGLLYTIIQENSRLKSLKIDGPVSILEHTERYGSRLAILMGYIASLPEWEINAKILIKDREKKDKKEYILKLGSDVSYYLPTRDIEEESRPDLPWPLELNPEPIAIEQKLYFPDYCVNIDNNNIYIDLSRSIYLEKNKQREKLMDENEINWETFYVLEKNERLIKGSICFKEVVDWKIVKKYLSEKYEKASVKTLIPELKSKNIASDSKFLEKIRIDVDSLYPDSDRIVEYLESRSLIPDEILRVLGYKTVWKGLKLLILR